MAEERRENPPGQNAGGDARRGVRRELAEDDNLKARRAFRRDAPQYPEIGQSNEQSYFVGRDVPEGSRSYDEDPYEGTWTEFDEEGTGNADQLWRVRGPYTGLGPRNYQRPDRRIYEEVCELLSDHGTLDASDIEVSVADGDVILDGEVDSRWAKRTAEDLAGEIPGVQDVFNNLRIRSKDRDQPFDS